MRSSVAQAAAAKQSKRMAARMKMVALKKQQQIAISNVSSNLLARRGVAVMTGGVISAYRNGISALQHSISAATTRYQQRISWLSVKAATSAWKISRIWQA